MKKAVQFATLISIILLACDCRSTMNLASNDMQSPDLKQYATIKGASRPFGYGANVKILAVDTTKASSWSSCYKAYVPAGNHFVVACGNKPFGLPRIGVAPYSIERVSAPIHFAAQPGHEYQLSSSIGWGEGSWYSPHVLHFELRDHKSGILVGKASQWTSSDFVNLNFIIMAGTLYQKTISE